MIDGVNISYSAAKTSHLLHLDNWEILVNEKTKLPINDNRTARFRALDMQLKPKLSKDGFNFIINGSLHKYFNKGLHNYDQFNFNNLVQSIDSLSDVLSISANEFEVHGLEIGLNIPLPFPPKRLLDNLVSYSNRPFDLMDKREAKTGLQCVLKQYKLKIYDKGKQSKTKDNILRFEVAFTKMQPLEKYGIKTLSDLQNFHKVKSLIQVLKDAFKRIIWTDRQTNLNTLEDRELKQWLSYSNPKTWELMTKHNRRYHAKKWNILFKNHAQVFDLESELENTWNTLFTTENEEKKAQKLLPFYRLDEEMKAVKIATFLPLVYSVRKSQTHISFSPPFKINNLPNMNIKKPPEKKRTCLSCSSDISHQKKQSLFCSEKYVGRKKAKQCRNKNSNHRLAKKRKIERAKKNDVFLNITYLENGNTYTDTLHPKELSTTKKWFDKILSITPIPKIRNG